jgi:hypothetical protein
MKLEVGKYIGTLETLKLRVRKIKVPVKGLL